MWLEKDGGGLIAMLTMSLTEAPEPQIAPDAGSSVGEYVWIPAPDEQVAPCRESAAKTRRG